MFVGRITIKKIAELADVSTATVSRVLNNEKYVSGEVRDRVMEIVKTHNYMTNVVAKNLKKRETNAIGILVPDLTNPYFMNIVKGIEDVLDPYEFMIYLASSNHSAETEKRMLTGFYENQMRTIVLSTNGECDDYVQQLHDLNQEIILIDRKISSIKDLSYVVENNFDNAYTLVKRVLEKGYTNIGVLTGLRNLSVGNERYQGVLKAFEEYGITNYEIHDGNYTIEGAREAMQRFEENSKIEVIIALNNSMAVGVLKELLSKTDSEFYQCLKIASYGRFEMYEFFKDYVIEILDQHPYQIGKIVGEVLEEKLMHHRDELKQISV